MLIVISESFLGYNCPANLFPLFPSQGTAGQEVTKTPYQNHSRCSYSYSAMTR